MRALIFLLVLLSGVAHADPELTRDPFRSLLMDGGPTVEGVLERPSLFGDLAVEDLTLSGVVATPSGPAALLVAADGRSSVARVGEYLGRDWARLEHIGDKSVSFRIELRDLEGVLVERRPVLRMAAAR